jgi:hypothetical protein
LGQARRSWVRILIRSLDFFSLPNPSSRTMALGSTQPLIEMSTRNVWGVAFFNYNSSSFVPVLMESPECRISNEVSDVSL